MSKIQYKVGWLYWLVLFLPMLACSSFTGLKVPTASNQELRQRLEAIPMAEPVHANVLQNTGLLTTTIAVSETEPIRLAMQHAWRAIFLPPQPYEGRISWTQYGHIGGGAEYQVIAFDKLSAEVTYEGDYRCIQDNDKPFFTAPSLQGAWVSALREEQVDPTGSNNIQLLKVCNEYFLTFLFKGTDPFDFLNNQAQPAAKFYRDIDEGETTAELATRFAIDKESIVGYNMVRDGVVIGIWLNAQTGQPLAMDYSGGQGEFHWEMTRQLDDLVIESPKVTQ